jgi:hypothetical protein
MGLVLGALPRTARQVLGPVEGREAETQRTEAQKAKTQRTGTQRAEDQPAENQPGDGPSLGEGQKGEERTRGAYYRHLRGWDLEEDWDWRRWRQGVESIVVIGAESAHLKPPGPGSGICHEFCCC